MYPTWKYCDILVNRVPLGVVVQLTAWNHPMLIGKFLWIILRAFERSNYCISHQEDCSSPRNGKFHRAEALGAGTCQCVGGMIVLSPMPLVTQCALLRHASFPPQLASLFAECGLPPGKSASHFVKFSQNWYPATY